ncbi:MAG: hypothetical protein JWR00_1022, partial [Rubritepida sp.]|nr:hypothetical protein [Rubritepida sp.]
MHAHFAPTDFLIAPGVAHLCAGGKTPALRTLNDAIARYL